VWHYLQEGGHLESCDSQAVRGIHYTSKEEEQGDIRVVSGI